MGYLLKCILSAEKCRKDFQVNIQLPLTSMEVTTDFHFENIENFSSPYLHP